MSLFVWPRKANILLLWATKCFGLVLFVFVIFDPLGVVETTLQKCGSRVSISERARVRISNISYQQPPGVLESAPSYHCCVQGRQKVLPPIFHLERIFSANTENTIFFALWLCSSESFTDCGYLFWLDALCELGESLSGLIVYCCNVKARL